MLKLRWITKEYKMWENTFQVLKWIDLDINKWDFLSIMWPSWSGKSTLMNIIWMLDIPTSWEYIFDTLKVTWKKESDLSKIRGKSIWFIFQSYNLISRMPVIKQVMLPLAYQWVSRWKREKLAMEALKKVWLEDKIHSKPNELSWWQQQRVSIARALAVNPWIILADEPTWALDTVTWKEIMDLLTDLNNEWKTIVLITHEKNVDAYAKRHIFLRDGNIVDNLNR